MISIHEEWLQIPEGGQSKAKGVNLKLFLSRWHTLAHNLE